MSERQKSKSLHKINMSHIARYEFAKKFIRNTFLVLDYGCGVGYGSFMLASKAKEVLALDKDLETICFAKENYQKENIEFRLGTLIMECRKWDVSVCFEVIEHSEEPDIILEEIVRSSKDEAYILISTPDGRVKPFSKEKYPYHVRHYRQLEFTKLLNDAGLKIIKKFTQPSKSIGTILPGWGGSYNIALCQKI